MAELIAQTEVEPGPAKVGDTVLTTEGELAKITHFDVLKEVTHKLNGLSVDVANAFSAQGELAWVKTDFESAVKKVEEAVESLAKALKGKEPVAPVPASTPVSSAPVQTAPAA